ncbi:MAG: glycosyltransferase [Bacteroidetes bacterium]|nr:MAG: glycosyltransferase [Bacteroidota bacterium]
MQGIKKKVIVSVINDLVTDQRVEKTCRLLADMNFEVTLVGRIKTDSLPMPSKPYKTKRMRLLFEKGPLFYAEYNIRLFLFLLFRKSSLLISNDLDTLLPNYLIHRLSKTPIVYDSHELFTETPEVINRKFVKSVWVKIESNILPKLKDVITVSGSIAEIFSEKYGIDVKVVRNIPPLRKVKNIKARKDINLPEDKKILILQGSGINIQRGAEELIDAMQYLNNHLLLVIGGGDVISSLKQQSTTLKLDNKVWFIPKQTFENLYQYTVNANLGLTLDKDTNLNYRFSLPNKLFDYIHAGIPILASPLVEISKTISKYNIGTTIDNHDPKHIAEKIENTLKNEKQLSIWKENLKFAAEDLSWDKEKDVLKMIYAQYA